MTQSNQMLIVKLAYQWKNSEQEDVSEVSCTKILYGDFFVKSVLEQVWLLHHLVLVCPQIWCSIYQILFDFYSK
jgi:hypothetical protein